MLSTQLIPLVGVADLVRGVGGMIFLFMLVVGIHEFGHLMWAKIFGVGAEEFSIGFGKRLCGFKWGGTVYSLRLIPLGGFVKIKGMIDALHEAEEREKATEPDRSTLVKDAVFESSLAMRDLALWKKILVFSGGVINNLILALVCFALLAWGIGLSNPEMPATVGWVKPDTSAATVGFERGDEILTVSGRDVSAEAHAKDAGNYRWPMALAMILEAEGDPVSFEVQRGDDVVPLTWATPVTDEKALVDMLKLQIPALVLGLTPYGPAGKAGLQEQDLIIRADGVSIEHWMDLQPVMIAASGEAVEYLVQRGDERLTLNIVADHKDYVDNGNGRWLIGFSPGISSNPEDIERLPLGQSVIWGTSKIWQITTMSYGFLWRAITFQTTFDEVKDNLGGPVVILDLGYAAANRSFEDFLWFAGLLNVILAIMNILPYPILDGGHIVFNVIESVRRRPFSLKILERIYTIAFAVLITFMLLVVFNDFSRLF